MPQHRALRQRAPRRLRVAVAVVAVALVVGSVAHLSQSFGGRPADPRVRSASYATAPPTAPRNLSVRASAPGVLTVAWLLPRTNSGDPGITYNLTASPSSASVPATRTTTKTSLVYDHLTAGTTYAFTVSASNTGGASRTVSGSAVALNRQLTGSVPVAGIAMYHRTLTASPTGFNTGAHYTYQWKAGKKSIAGATGATFLVSDPRLIGQRVTVTAIARQAGMIDSAPTTASTAPISPYNPLAGGPWPSDSANGGNWDADLIGSYHRASGSNRTQLGKLALRPRATWFGAWMSPAASASQVRNYIATEQNGNRQALVQMSLFSIFSVAGGEGNTGPMSGQQVATYRAWYSAVAQAIGTTRVSIIMEPDLAMLAPPMSGERPYADASRRMGLISWATQLLANNPNATIYLDSGDSDWQRVSTMAPILKASGIGYARGFALGATHYASIADNIAYAVAMKRTLAGLGLSDKHAVIDTADNGKAFTFMQYKARYGSGSFDNATACSSSSAPPPCDTLGTPPTWQVADTKVPLTATQRTQALDAVDAYLWFGRPWLSNQAWPFDLARAIQVAASSPYA